MVFTNDGANLIRDWMAGDGPTAPGWINIGTDSTAPTKSDTTLGTEIQRDAISSIDTSDKQVTFEIEVSSNEQIGESIVEVGINNANTAGVQITRAVHAPIVKTSTIEIKYRLRLRVLN